MTSTKQKETQRVYRHKRIRKKISGTSSNPRLCVYRSNKNIYIQAIDDSSNKVILGMSTNAASIKKSVKNGGNINAATLLGESFAQEAKKKGLTKVSFDRGGYLYHGRVKALAEALRKGGMEF